MRIRVGTRSSPLALKQVEEIAKLFPEIKFDTIAIDTTGDIDKMKPLSSVEGDDFFTRQIDEALLAGAIDVAIHSAKDLPDVPAKGLEIAALTKSISSRECLVSQEGKKLKELHAGAVVGTSSTKRKEAILRYRNDVIVKDIRGDIGKRLIQLDEGHYDAIIVAHAAMLRLGYEDRIAEIFSASIMEPHPLQGRLAIQVHKDRKDLLAIFGVLNGK